MLLKHFCNIRRVSQRQPQFVLKRRSSTGAQRRVALHDFHVSRGARLVAFAGFLMPVQYADAGIGASHAHTRRHVSVFDVSHMLQTQVTGRDRAAYMESLVVSDIQGLADRQGTLTVFTNDAGGIIDDLIVTKDDDLLYVVSNAGCAEKDLKHMQTKKAELVKKGLDVNLEVLTDKVLLAIQGPGSAKVLQSVVGHDLSSLYFMSTVRTAISGVENCRISRCGYTGEDGFEISIPAGQSRLILESLLDSRVDSVRLAGLGARDTLRLEAGLCLYGNDITDSTTPVEAGLAWTIGKRRRAEGGFPGADIILKQLKEKPALKRVGFLSDGPCPRGSTAVMNTSGRVIGKITSGCPSPCLKRNISMGYVEASSVKIGDKVKFVIHKKEVEGCVAKMPFVPSKYYVK